jgi:hypothetical protein
MRFFGHDIPKLSWLGGKTARQGNGGRKNRSGYVPEHTAAILDDQLRTLKQVTSDPGVIAALEADGKAIDQQAVAGFIEEQLEEKNLQGAGL